MTACFVARIDPKPQGEAGNFGGVANVRLGMQACSRYVQRGHLPWTLQSYVSEMMGVRVGSLHKLIVSWGVSALALVTAATGCGASDGKASEREPVIIQEANYPAPPVAVLRKVRRCLVDAGVDLRMKTKKGWNFRIVGVLPADEIGFGELPGGGVVNLWVTVSPKEAKRVAEVANRRNRGTAIGTGRNDAEAHGSGVAALSVTPTVPRGAEADVYPCLRAS
jgi:hypothetical protein